MTPTAEQKYAELTALFSPAEVEKAQLRRAFDVAFLALHGRERENGDPFIFHPLDVAKIVASEVGIGAQATAAVLLHEADRLVATSETELLSKFGKETVGIVAGLRKISQLDIKATALQAEAFRRLLVSYSTDPRVIIIKLADRLEVMRSLTFFPKSKHPKKSAETLLLYAPLAHKLGLYKLKSELEDLSLRYTDSAAYRDINTKLALGEKLRGELVQSFIDPIKNELAKKGYQVDLKYRTKSVYSIWSKMQKQKVPFEGVFDLFAIRIILDNPFENREAEVAACWDVYSVITSEHAPDLQRLRDWVTKPKSNGYESLHTTVNVVDRQDVEVQIRTRRMDDNAEHGTAAHWRYKGVQQAEGGVEQWLANVRHQLETEGSAGDYDAQFTPHEVFVFTPTGDLRQLKMGATVLDFAFDIHTGLGCRCTGAIRNGKHVPIRERLQTGDVVEILTAKNQTPTLDWLSYVATSKAKNKIRQKLREAQQKHTDEEETHHERELPKKEPPRKVVSASQSTDYIVLDDQLKGVDCKLAKCCSPIYGDDLFGFVTVGSGVTIHRTSCPNAERLISQYAYRVIAATWRAREVSKKR